MPSWPWTFATLPAGNVAASKLDDNFNAAMFSAGSSTNGAVPTWNGTTGAALNTGGLVVGTGANNLVQLDGSGLLPTSVIPSTGIGAATAYVFANTAGTIQFSKNVTSITKIGTGQYEINFTTAAPSANYVVVATSEGGGPGLFATIISKTAAKVTVGTSNTVTQAYQDSNIDVVTFW